MLEKKITPIEFEKHLQEFVGQELTEYFYITDSIVVFNSGKKFPEDKNNPNSKLRSEYEFWINGPWKYIENDKVVETSIPTQDEDISNLRGRLEDFIMGLKVKKVIGVSMLDDGQTAEISFDNGGKFVVSAKKDSFVELSHRIYSQDGDFIRAFHVRPDEENGELTLIEAP